MLSVLPMRVSNRDHSPDRGVGIVWSVFNDFALIYLEDAISELGSAYGSRTRAPVLRGLRASLEAGLALLLCCYFSHRPPRFIGSR